VQSLHSPQVAAYRDGTAIGRGPESESLRAPAEADTRALIERAVRGKGGLELLKSVRTVRAVSDTILEMPGGAVTIPTTIRVRYPGGFRIDTEMPTGPVVQAFDNGTYWVRDSRGVNVAPDETAESMRGNVQRDPIALLLALSDGRVAARRAADVSIDGRLMPALVVDLKLSGPLTLVLHPESGLILRERYPAAREGGEVEETFSDYRDVNGLQVAFSVSLRHPGLPPLMRVIRKFEYNVPLSASLFSKPS
jgi:hypothetical protein